MSLSDLGVKGVVAATGAEVLSLHQETFSEVGTDTRLDLTGQLFVALRGERFDAHDFVDRAVEQKATVLLLDQREIAQKWSNKVTCLWVEDTLKAFQDLAHYWRKQISAKVVAITGSNGKTTVKDFLATIVKKERQVTASRGSFNNHWGVPRTLLSCKKSDEVVILEMGMNHLGELTRLCQIAEPDITLVTQVGCAHIGKLGSLDRVAQAKSEIYKESPQSQGVFNLDNEYTLKMFESFTGIQRLTFSQRHPESTVCLHVVEMGWDFIQVEGHIHSIKGSARVPVFGAHNVQNVMAAAAAAVAVGLSPQKIWRALGECRTSWGRNQMMELRSGARVLFDAYNSNPESLRALVENLSQVLQGEFPLEHSHLRGTQQSGLPSRGLYGESSLFQQKKKKRGRLFFVVGQMGELGEESPKRHYEIGQIIGGVGPDLVWFIGEDQRPFQEGLESSSFQKISYFSRSYKESIALNIGSMLKDHDRVVLKGSRAVKLERVLRDWSPIDFE